jgi:hypothetical protein
VEQRQWTAPLGSTQPVDGVVDERSPAKRRLAAHGRHTVRPHQRGVDGGGAAQAGGLRGHQESDTQRKLAALSLHGRRPRLETAAHRRGRWWRRKKQPTVRA